MRDEPLESHDLVVAADHGQIYIYSPDGIDQEDEDIFLDALDDAVQSGRFVGVAGGLVDLMTPGQWNFNTPMRLEVWTREPEMEAGWDHSVDVDLDVPDGQLIIEASGSTRRTDTSITSGRYRARISGRGFQKLGAAGANGDDNYRLQLWPREVDAQPELRILWPGWQAYST